MGDTYGALPLPAGRDTASGDPSLLDPAIGDPSLDKLGAYLVAVLNAKLGAAWDRLCPGQPVAREHHVNSPEEGEFSENDLPALYLWRESDAFEAAADDYSVARSKIAVVWAYEASPQWPRAAYSTFAAAVAKALSQAIWNERDPAWIDPDDTDPNAADQGSNIIAACGWFGLPLVTEDRSLPVHVETADDEIRRRTYGARRITIEVSELLEQSPGDRPGVVPAKVTIDFFVNPDLAVGEYRNPD